MPEISLSGFLIVAAVAFGIPLLLGLVPRLRLPAVVLEIVAGIVLGPSVLGWVEEDVALQVMALLGLAFLLFLAGLEIDLDKLRGTLLRRTGGGFVISFAIAVAVGFGLFAAGLITAPLLIAIIISSTGLGIVVPVLKDARQSATTFGQLVIGGASIADFGVVILLSLFFSREATSVASTIVLLGGFLLVLVALALALSRAGRGHRLSAALLRLQDSSSQIRVRGAVLLLVAFTWLAQRFGLETILGAFLAGAVLRLLDRDDAMTHPLLRAKLEAVGFGVFVPFFFVVRGIRLDVAALLVRPAALLHVPLFLAALLIVRGVPALVYRPLITSRATVGAGLLQATSLPFIVAATDIGMELNLLSATTGAALVVAGLMSVVCFPLVALTVLRGEAEQRTGAAPDAVPPSTRAEQLP